VEMVGDEERRKWTFCSSCTLWSGLCDFLVNAGLLKPNTGTQATVPLLTDDSIASPQREQQARNEAGPVVPDYVKMRDPAEPADTAQRIAIVRCARSLQPRVVQERIVRQEPAAHMRTEWSEGYEASFLAEDQHSIDILR